MTSPDTGAPPVSIPRAVAAAVAVLTARRLGEPPDLAMVLDDGQPPLELLTGALALCEWLLDWSTEGPETTLTYAALRTAALEAPR